MRIRIETVRRRGPPDALVALTFVAATVMACGGSTAKPSNGGASSAVTPRPNPAAQTATGLQPVIASSELVVGQNRFTLGVLDRTGTPIPDATVHLRFFQLSGTPTAGGTAQGVLKVETDAVYRSPGREAGLPAVETVARPDGTKIVVQSGTDVGIYAATVNFDQPGDWGVEAQVTAATKDKSGIVRTPFKVLPQSSTPAIGSPAPPSHNLTVKDVTDLSIIDTSAHPTPDMHTETVADGLAAHHPLMVLFATPGYCTSRLCGPELELARKLEPKYQGKADFIHIEIYKDPANRVTMPAVDEWHLQSEPWFFIVDKDGKIAAKFEGPTTLEELDAALQKVAP